MADETFRDLLWRKFRETNLSQADFAKQLGIGQATLSRYLNGEGAPANWRTAREVAARLGATIDELDHLIAVQRSGQIRGSARELRPTDLLYLPLHGFIPAGRPDVIEQNDERLVALFLSDESRAWLARHVRNPQAVIAVGSSMSGWVESGSVVVFDPDARPKSGDIVVAVVAGEMTLKQFIRADDETILRSTNPDRFPDMSIRDESGGYVQGVVRMAIPPAQPRYFGIRDAKGR